MKFKSLIIAAALGLSLGTVHAADIKMVDGIAAVVDNSVITYRDLNQALATARTAMPKGNSITEEELRRQVLGQLINQSLIVQAGKRRNINATETEIDEALAQTAQARKTTVDQLYTQAARDGLSRSALRRNVADSLITQKVQQQAIMQNARVSEAEIDAFLNHAREQNITLPEGEPVRQYHARHILIKADGTNQAANAAAEAEIRKIAAQARSGSDFSALARAHSQDGSAPNGGDLGWFTDGVMVPEFEHAVQRLRRGQVSQPVRSQFGWHVIKLEDVRDAGTPEERRRNAVRQYLSDQKAQRATTDLLQQLHSSAFIDIRN